MDGRRAMMHLKEICRIVRGVLRTPEERFVIPAPVSPITVRGVSTDTRTLKEGDIFFALRGPNFDGHNFVEEAFRKGAVAVVVRRTVPASGPQILVENVLTALGNLAAIYRMMLGARVVGITGSNGKTTTKEMVAHILGADRKVVQARDSWNNLIGVPLTLFRATPDTEVLILEIGTNRSGEVARLGSIARPDAAVITSVSEAHLEGLGSLEGVAEEKASLLGTLRGSGFCVVPLGPPCFWEKVQIPKDKRITFGLEDGADVRATDIARSFDGLVFRVRGAVFRLGMLGLANVTNALAAAAVAGQFGVSLEECAARLQDFRPPKMRMERLRIGPFLLLNDAYNSNPASALHALREFVEMPVSGRRVVIFGAMKELGARSRHWHERVGSVLAEARGVDLVVGIGPETLHMLDRVEGIHFPTVQEAGSSVRDFLRAGDTILLKGSRAVGLENLIKAISEEFREVERVGA